MRLLCSEFSRTVSIQVVKQKRQSAACKVGFSKRIEAVGRSKKTWSENIKVLYKYK